MYQIKASWNPNRAEEGKIHISKDFEDLEWIEKMDFLNDILHDLTKLYHETLEKGIPA